MKSKPYVWWLILGGIALALWLAWPSKISVPPNTRTEPQAVTGASPIVPSTPSLASAPQTPLPVPTPSSNAPGVVQPPTAGLMASGPATSATASPLSPGEPNQAAQINVERVRHMIGDYHTLMGENPVGTNAEIMMQMTGGNARQATLGPPEGISLNAQGELIDQWGVPYFFHQLSRDKMEVRSAGPDKVMWTADDVIAR